VTNVGSKDHRESSSLCIEPTGFEEDWELQVRRAVFEALEGTLLPYAMELRDRQKIYNMIIRDVVASVRTARPSLDKDSLS
jgi:hypothetical protein